MQKITSNITGRVETGALQINNDWPGIFIRGDNAAYYSLNLKQIKRLIEINNINLHPLMEGAALKDLIAMLDSCCV